MKTLRISALILVAVLTMGLSGCLVAPIPYAASGRVTDSVSGLGIPGVTIRFGRGFSPVVTAEDGTWIKDGLRGTVTVRPSKPGLEFAPWAAVIDRSNALNIDFVASPMVVETVYWYSFANEANFEGGTDPFNPTDELTSVYGVTVNDSSELTTAPEGYDALVICDTGASFDVTEFDGPVIVTLDSGISPLFFWLTGSADWGDYWDYETGGTLTWVTPDIGTESGYDYDALVFHDLEDSLAGFVRRNDLLEAYSTADADDIVIYEIESDGKYWWWVHVGPAHIGDNRTSDIVRYALDLINGFDSTLEPVPPPEPSAAHPRSSSNNK